LYRSEFPFLVRDHFPTEEEQFWIYSKLFSELPNQPIALRTLDIGGDKVLSHFPISEERNPFLGMRSIRFSLQNPEIFKTQLRAMLRASEGHDVGIMFPMISSFDEFLVAKQIVKECSDTLTSQEIAHNENPRIGLMVEIPSVISVLEELSKEADFFCIGTNDLIQYMLAVDRTNEKVSNLYIPHHPSVLRALNKIVSVINETGKEVSICGDMAGDKKLIPFLLGIGLKKFSVNPTTIPSVLRLH